MTTAGAHRKMLLWTLLAAAVGTNAYWFAAGPAFDGESAPRIALGALLVFLVPGLVLGELVGLRSSHALESLGLAFILSLLIEMLLLTGVLVCGTGIGTWALLLLLNCVLMLAALGWRARRVAKFRFLTPLISLGRGTPADRGLSLLAVLCPFALAAVAYAWGETPLDLGGEKLLHLSFVRLYREVPLVLDDLGIDRGLPPPNFVHLWEFLLAGWSRLVQIDPLPLFHRARCVVPVIGLSGLYLLVKAIFPQRHKTKLVFLLVVLGCVSALVLHSPSLAWITATDPTRGVFAFLATAHHADSAIDMLIAVTAATALGMFRRPGRQTAMMFVTMLVANFLWHPRELFQLALYVGMFAALLVATPALWRRRYFVRWGLVAAATVSCVGLCAVLSAALIGQQEQASHEAPIKHRAIEYAQQPENLLGVRNLFNIPFHFKLNEFGTDRLFPWSEIREKILAGSWLFDGWLMLSAVAAALASLLGRASDRRLATYYLLLWGLTLCWNAGLLALLALTYSEFFMSTPRLLYLFAYLVIADAMLLAVGQLSRGLATLWSSVVGPEQALRAKWIVPMQTCCVALALGFGFQAWQQAQLPAAHSLSVALSLLVPLVVFVAAWLPDRATGGSTATPAIGAACALFFLPLVSSTCVEGWRSGQFSPRSEIAWCDPDNPLGISPEVIGWTRTIEPESKVLVDPTRNDYLSIHAPVYLALSPVASVLRDMAARREIVAGEHPLFPPLPEQRKPASVVDHGRVRAWLSGAQVDYVLLAGDRYQGVMRDYYRSHLDDYEIVLDRPSSRELVVRCRRTSEEQTANGRAPQSR